MKNTFGNNIAITLFGESHGASIGLVIDGLPAGLAVNEDSIRAALSLRRPQGKISTARQEADPFVLESGVFEGKTTGTPLCIRIPNADTRSGDYSRSAARPGHADYTAFVKYGGYEDYRGGGHFSGRLTAALVAGGAIVTDALAQKGIIIGTHIRKIAGICDRALADLEQDIATVRQKSFPVLDEAAGEQMKAAILAAREAQNSVGGELESVVLGMPAGVGEPWFDALESTIAHGLFSIPAVKGVSFGDGFAVADGRGSDINDEMQYIDGKVECLTNHNGGILGGITNGMPLKINIAVKPTPTIGAEQRTVSLTEPKNITLSSGGRHDPCIVHRAAIVANAMLAFCVADALSGTYGTKWWTE